MMKAILEKCSRTAALRLALLACAAALLCASCRRSSGNEQYVDYCKYVLDQTQTVSCRIDFTQEVRTSKTKPDGTPDTEQMKPITTTTVIYEAAPDKLRVEMTMPVPTKSGVEFLKFFMLSDGTYQWCELPIGGGNKSYVRTNMKELGSKDRPFNTSVTIVGSGLLAGQGLIGTVRTLLRLYTVKQVYTGDLNGTSCIILEGELDQGEFEDYLEETMQTLDTESEAANLFLKNISMARLYFAESDYFLRKFELCPSANDPNPKSYLKVVAVLNDVQLNAALPQDAFAYHPPAGITVKDITEVIKEKRKQLKEGK